MTVVDVGAHVGVYSLLAARLLAGSGVVHAIEPQQELVALIENTAALNKLANVRSHCLALADTDGESGLVVDRHTMGGFVGSTREGNATPVRARTLQAFATEEHIGRVDVLKLDAAGNELAILRGAGTFLEQRVGSIVCKLYHPDTVAERFGTHCGPAAIVDVLRDCGYQITLPDGRAAEDEVLEVLFADGRYSVPILALRSGGQTEP